MKANYLLTAGMVLALGAGFLPARTWTSADGSKTFEGDYKSYDPDAGKVTVLMRSGKSLTFDVAKLSDDDKTWVEEKFKEDNAPDPGEALAEQKIGSKLAKAGILQKLDGKRYGKFEFEEAPEYYILYFSASW